MARSVATVSASMGRLSAKWPRSACARSVSIVVQHSMVARSSQCTSVIPPASPAAFIARENWGTFASNVGMHMKIFMLDWPARTAGPTSSATRPGDTITV